MKFLGLLLFTVSFASTASAKTLVAMNYVEKSAYALQRLVNQNHVDPSFLTDVNAERIAVTNLGAQIELQSPSADPNMVNTITLNFDAKGTLTSFTTNFVSKDPQGPLFSPVNAATILDLGAEAVVDHLAESADLPVVARDAQGLSIAKEGSGFHIRILLNDGRTYNILMDDQANVVSKGF
jgi:hypothetical protein